MFLGGIDGCFMRLSNIKKVLEGHNANHYICRRQYHALNVLIYAGYDHRIYDMVSIFN